MRSKLHEVVCGIAEAQSRRRLLLFCGAGVSVSSGVPTAAEFLSNSGIKTLPWAKGTTLLSQKKRFENDFQRTFNSDTLTPSPQHRLIASLDASVCVTTNYDLLLERAHVDIHGSKHVGVISKPEHLQLSSSQKNLIIKLHGDVEDPTLRVITAADYMTRWRTPSAVDSFVFHLFYTHTVLFIGYALEDAHILSILEEQTRAPSGGLPDRFAIVRKPNRERDQYLETMCVRPIPLDHTRDFDAAVCEFLFAIWERSNHHLAFSAPIELRKQSLSERLRFAMQQRQQGFLNEVKPTLQKLTTDILETAPIDLQLLPGLLWLNVSLYDKLEDWGTLRMLDANKFQPVLDKLEASVPPRVLASIRSGYDSTIAVALIRQGDFVEAKRRLDRSINSPSTENADSSLQIVFAAALTARAISCLGLWTEYSSGGHLETASEDLDRAWTLFKAHGGLGTQNESHHLGRFFGTSALVKLAKRELLPPSDQELVVNTEKILEEATQAHAGTNRTTYGKIAGRWCHAFCCYKLAQGIHLDPSRRKQLLSQALSLISIALGGTSETQIAARLKLCLLRREVLQANGEDSNDVEDRKTIATLRARLDKDLKKVIRRLTEHKWLQLPLN
jgi:hypothetical protein